MKTEIQKKRRFRIYSALTAFFALILGGSIAASNINFKSNLFTKASDQSNYSITLDSTNKVTSAGDHVQKTKLGNNVAFTYTGISNSTSCHVTFNTNGSLINKDHIRSIQTITATFNTASALKFKVSFDGSTTGGETVMESGRTYELGSSPYYLHLYATQQVTLQSLVITYSCTENPDAAGHEVITETSWEKVTNVNQLSVGDNVVFVATYNTSYYALKNDYATSSTYWWYLAANSITVSGTTADVTSTHSIWVVSNGSTSGTLKFNNGSDYLSGGYYDSHYDISKDEKTGLSSDWHVSIDSDGVLAMYAVGTASGDTYFAFTMYNNSKPEFLGNSTYSKYDISIYKEIPASSETVYDKPEESIIGFTAIDSKANSYYHDDIFDNVNGISVTAQKTGGSSEAVSKGGENGYSYVVKNSNGQTINTAQAFGSEGIYTLIVSYKNFIPVEIQLNVGFHVVLTGIEVVSTNTIFNTAQKLSDFTSGITANLTYNRESENEENVAYSSFASKGLTMTLLNPSGVTYPISSLFGTAGTWTIKVASNSNASVFGTVAITINAIPVTGISVTGSETEVAVDSQIQLTVSVTPNTATNQTVTWSSNHENIATVNTYGVVTGVSEGEVRITATANDGSAVYGYIDITVTPKPVQTDFDADMAAGSSAMACTVDGNDGVKVGTSKAAGSMTITVGEGATKLSFYAAGWNGTSTVINLSGATIGTTSFSLIADSGISGSGTAYTLSGTESDYYYETTLSGITSQTDITISASTRFALWKAKYYTTQVDPVYPTAISLTAGSNSISIGGTTSVEVGYTPSDTNVKNVTFSSNATSIATVSSEGIITGIAAGSARITATAEAENSGSVSAYVDITVNAIAVSGIALNKNALSLTVDGGEQLTATIAPSNATNKNVNWSSDATSIATVSSSGYVTAKAVGTATITVTSAADSSKKASCTVTVTASGGSGGSTAQESFTINVSDIPSAYSGTSFTASGYSFGCSNINNTSTSGAMQFKSGQGYMYNSDAIANILSISVASAGSNTFSATIYVGSSSHPTSGTSYQITNGNTVSISGSPSYFTIKANTVSGGAKCGTITITTGAATPTNPTSISINPSSVELAPGGSKDLAVNYTPSTANQNLDVTWTRTSGSSNITVNSAGKVTVSSNASAGNTAVIQAKLTNLTSITATCTVTVVEQASDDQTILIYLCGSDLESNGQTSSSSASGYASGDITEILNTNGQPDDVNVVIETGGAKCWKTTHGINKSYLERYHVANKSLVRDSQETKANMGLSSTLQSFLTWGVQNYPADRISLILWNHGGAMRGVCYDENYSSDSLTNSEVKTAVANTFTSLGRSTSDKFEWIGYDACLMQVQDIAEFNSQYFNYMIASEESEAGAGWDYDNWIDDAYAKKDTPTILKAICDSFISEQGGVNSNYNDQTLSYLDLSYMSAYKTAWESMASALNSLISSYGASNFRTLMKTCKCYGTDDDSAGYSYFGILDAKDVMNKIKAKSNFSSASTQINNAITAFNNLVAYSSCGKGAGNSYGLCCFFPMTDGSGYTCQTSKYYKASETNFSNWLSIVTSYGE